MYHGMMGKDTCNMAIRVVEFSNRGTKLERLLPKNHHTERKLLNFENWINGGLKSFQNQCFKSQLFSSSQKKILQIEIMA